MTHALHNMLHIKTDDTVAVHELARQVLLTGDEIRIEGKRMTRKRMADLTHAAKLLDKSQNVDVLPPLISTAAVTGDPALKQLVEDKIDAKFPVDTEHAISNLTNRYLRADYKRAIQIMKRGEMTAPQAVLLATTIGDVATNNNPAFAAVDDQRGLDARKELQKKLEAEEARIRARHELANEQDETVPYDPFADDEDEENAA